MEEHSWIVDAGPRPPQTNHIIAPHKSRPDVPDNPHPCRQSARDRPARSNQAAIAFQIGFLSFATNSS